MSEDEIYEALRRPHDPAHPCDSTRILYKTWATIMGSPSTHLARARETSERSGGTVFMRKSQWGELP